MSLLTAPLPLAHSAETELPDLGPNVLVVDSSTPDLQAKLDAIFAQQESARTAQFGRGRHAILFKPGRYAADVKVGYYTQVLGLGHRPGDVNLTGALRSRSALDNNNATCNFWRAAENLAVVPTQKAGGAAGNKVNVWAVSQATALRRVHIRGDLALSDGGWSSGGFLADTKVDGRINAGSQQQWLSRNSTFSGWSGGAWNMVYVGCPTAPTEPWPERPNTVIDATPIIREKPYLTLNPAGECSVQVPAYARNTRGLTWEAGSPAPGKSLPLSAFHVARVGTDTAATLNAALAAGKHLLITPGIYSLDAPLKISRPNTVVLGLGYATLAVTEGTAAIEVADVPGVALAGLLLDAGTKKSPTLLRVGEPGVSTEHADNPISLHDIYCRAGGDVLGRTKSFVVIHANHVVGDNFWLWRADHGNAHEWTASTVDNGLVVHGNDVTLYGLFVEHTQAHQTLWLGERGRTYFYQSEMPYDPPSPEAWMDGASKGFASYKVGENVRTHEAWGLGVYCVFTQASIIADRAFECPPHLEPNLHHLTAIRLSGKPDSGINRVLNDKGEPVITKQKSILN